ncbi:hypothetical protein ABH994_007487 [Bradyrhizobium yuanmingense]
MSHLLRDLPLLRSGRAAPCEYRAFRPLGRFQVADSL